MKRNQYARDCHLSTKINERNIKNILAEQENIEIFVLIL
jgi:hypothetical protein